jgi:hypothetical protein
MASTITITCPECDKTLRAPREVLGKKIRCKECGATFSARAARAAEDLEDDDDDDRRRPAPKPKKAPAAKPVAAKAKNNKPKDPDDEDSPYDVTTEYLGARCPSCANAMEEGDRICLHCGYDTETRVQSKTRKVRDQTGADIFLWLLPGILLALLTIGLITGQLMYVIMISREQFGDAWYDFIGSLGMKVWTSVVVLFICYYAGKFAIIRLCIDNKPPEVEEHFKHG